MGCMTSSARHPVGSPAELPHDGADASGEEVDAVGSDDLGWILAGGPSGSGPGVPPTREINFQASVKRPFEGVRVQIELPGGWKDCSPEEARQVCELRAKGETTFNLHARGQNYTIDIVDPEGASQINVSTGKKTQVENP